MRVLVAAYCCAPGSGSEQAFGWWWVTTCAHTHEVIVLTPSAQRAAIEDAAGSIPPRLRFEYVDGPRRVSSSGSSYRFERIQQYAWSLRAIRRARAIARDVRPDVAQQVTTGTWRVPSPLAFTGVPYVLGPLAGSEHVPPRLFSSLTPRGYAREKLRAAQVRLAKIDPLVRLTLRRASVILAAGPVTYQALQAWHPGKTRPATRAFAHPRIDRTVEAQPDESRPDTDICWVGQLIPRKGLDLLLTALTDERLRHCRLGVYGDGPERQRCGELATRLGIADRVVFHGHVDQARTFDAIRRCDLFVFTSLHDLMGQALSEAMQLGAACVVLDWSGPAHLVGDDGALKVPVSDFYGTVAALADTIASAATDPVLRTTLRRCARERISALIDEGSSSAARDEVFALARASAAR